MGNYSKKDFSNIYQKEDSDNLTTEGEIKEYELPIIPKDDQENNYFPRYSGNKTFHDNIEGKISSNRNSINQNQQNNKNINFEVTQDLNNINITPNIKINNNQNMTNKYSKDSLIKNKDIPTLPLNCFGKDNISTNNKGKSFFGY